MLQSSLPTFVLRHRFYRPAAGTPPFGIYDLRYSIFDLVRRAVRHLALFGTEDGSGGRNYTGLKRFMRPSSVL